MVEVTVKEGSDVVTVKEGSDVVVRRRKMRRDLYELFAWFEYLTRAEPTPDGN